MGASHDGGRAELDKTRRVQRTSIHLALRTNFSQHYIMDQSLAKRTLQELIKREDLKNKTCIDCGNPNPQWASLRFTMISFCSFSATRCLIGAAPLASPYLFACNALGFIEVSACTSGEFVYVQVVSLRTFSNPPVHSFVRSVSMDTWQEEQIRRMQVRQPTCSLGCSLQKKKFSSEEMAHSLHSCSHTSLQNKVAIRRTCQSMISIIAGRRHSIVKKL